MNQPHNCDNFHHNYTILAKIGLGSVQLIELWDKGARGARGGRMELGKREGHVPG